MELRDLRLVVALADELHFGRAADRLHVGQPALSQQLRRIERRLGVQLFDRSTHHVRLSPAGHAFVHRARPILAHVEALEDTMREHRPEQHLVVGTVNPTYDVSLTLLTALRTRLDGITVTERAVPNLRTAQPMLVRGELDLYLGVLGPSEGLEARPLRSDRFGLYLPAGHRLAAQDAVALRDVADLPVVVDPHDDAPELLALVERMFHRAGARLLRTPGASGSVDAAVLAVERGGPPVVGPRSPVVPPGVRWVAFAEAWAHDTLHLVRLAGPPSPAVTAALDLTADVVAEQGWVVLEDGSP